MSSQNKVMQSTFSETFSVSVCLLERSYQDVRQQNDIIVPTKPTEIHACDFSSFPQGVAYTAMNGG